jgi:hypothetical protein
MWADGSLGRLTAVLGRVVAGLVVGGGLLLGMTSAPAPVVPALPSVSLHPNHMAVKPGGDSAVAATPGWASSNWSGYAVTAGATPFTSVTGHWKVPSVSRTRTASFSAAWVGIDGFNNNSLIQTGTEQDYYNGAPHFAAWWTTSAQNFLEQVIPKPVSAGDLMTATINGTGTSWTVTLADHSSSHPWTFTRGPIAYTGPGASAEWIMEAPTVNGRVAPVARYSSPTAFDPGTLNGASPNLSANEGGELVQGSSLHSQVFSIPSGPDPERDGFNISYGSTAPSPPSS